MKRTTTYIVLALISLQVYAQEPGLHAKLKQYDFETAFLTTSLKDADAEHQFNLTTTIMSTKDTTVEKIKFDPAREIGTRWELLFVNNSKPTEDELDEFDYTHNTKAKKVNATVDETTLKVHAEDEYYLVVEFSFDKKTLPQKAKYLKDCVGYAHINKKTKKLEKAEFKNTEQLRVRTIKVNQLKMTVNYSFLRQEGVYQISDEIMEMSTFYHGRFIDVTIENQYSDYKRIR